MKIQKVRMRQQMEQLEANIISWYEAVKRDFPWRHTKNPYYIWICEVMSQQTQLARVVDYYERFITIFPTLTDLAHAAEDDLLKAWEGLGYYSRVRNMQTAALQILADFNGQFPSTYDELLSLKGVGSYTAAAIASIAFDVPVAAVDGNVLRVYTRLCLIEDDILAQKTKNKIKVLLEEEMTTLNPSSFNQGMIELGATVCLPQKPACQHCPLQHMCCAYAEKRTNMYPVKKKRTKQKEEQYYTFMLTYGDKLYLRKQADSKLLQGLYALPQYENNDDLEEALDLLRRDTGCDIVSQRVVFKGQYKHIFSHKIWLMDVYIVPIMTDGKHFHDSAHVPLANAHRNVISQ